MRRASSASACPQIRRSMPSSTAAGAVLSAMRRVGACVTTAVFGFPVSQSIELSSQRVKPQLQSFTPSVVAASKAVTGLSRCVSECMMIVRHRARS